MPPESGVQTPPEKRAAVPPSKPTTRSPVSVTIAERTMPPAPGGTGTRGKTRPAPSGRATSGTAAGEAARIEESRRRIERSLHPAHARRRVPDRHDVEPDGPLLARGVLGEPSPRGTEDSG